jgi:hypothetical protein
VAQDIALSRQADMKNPLDLQGFLHFQ